MQISAWVLVEQLEALIQAEAPLHPGQQIARLAIIFRLAHRLHRVYLVVAADLASRDMI